MVLLSRQRCALLVWAMAVTLAGCTSMARPEAPGASLLPARPASPTRPSKHLTVFCDGFHSGLLIRKADLGLALDDSLVGEAPSYPWWTIHFGERRWMLAEDTTLSHALGLFFRPLPGGLQINHTTPDLDNVGVDQEHLRRWTFTVSDADLANLRARLREHWLREVLEARPEWDNTLTVAAPLDWSVWENCHDFTVDLLRAAGIDLPHRTLYLAGGLSRDLDDVQAERER